MTVRTNRPTRQLAVENDPPNTSSKRQVTSADATENFSSKAKPSAKLFLEKQSTSTELASTHYRVCRSRSQLHPESSATTVKSGER